MRGGAGGQRVDVSTYCLQSSAGPRSWDGLEKVGKSDERSVRAREPRAPTKGRRDYRPDVSTWSPRAATAQSGPSRPSDRPSANFDSDIWHYLAFLTALAISNHWSHRHNELSMTSS